MKKRGLSMDKLLWEVDFNYEPYKYFFCNSAFTKDVSAAILEWLKTSAPWKRVNETFYDQYEFSVYDAKIPTTAGFLISSDFKKKVKRFAEHTFDAALADEIDIVAHKLINGDTIKIHNDYIEGRESHRILFNFNDNWCEENGGYFMVFSSPDPDNIQDLFLPINGSMHGFEISRNSHHAVSKVYNNTRYSIIYSFYRK